MLVGGGGPFVIFFVLFESRVCLCFLLSCKVNREKELTMVNVINGLCNFSPFPSKESNYLYISGL